MVCHSLNMMLFLGVMLLVSARSASTLENPDGGVEDGASVYGVGADPVMRGLEHESDDGPVYPLGVCDNFITPASDFYRNCAPYMNQVLVEFMYRTCLHHVENDTTGIHDFLDGIERTCQSYGHGVTIHGGCASKPCQNGGVCLQYPDVSFECQCMDSFKGIYCQDGPESYVDYTGHKVVEITPTTAAHVGYLKDLVNGKHQVNFLSHPHSVGSNVAMVLSPQQELLLRDEFNVTGLNWLITDENYGESVVKERARFTQRLRRGVAAFDVHDFNTLEQIDDWLENAAVAKCRQKGLNCGTKIIGRSVQGTDIKIFSMSTRTPHPGTGTHRARPAFYIDSLIHGREWIAGSSVLMMMYHMMENYERNNLTSNVTYLMNTYDWIFLPVANPDGYKYTQIDRLWRKNRRPDNIIQNCFGVDLNRNFNFKFGWNGYSDYPCNYLSFHGVAGQPEPETKAIGSLLCAVSKRLFAMVTIHTHSNVVVYPWGQATEKGRRVCDKAADNDDMLAVAEAAAKEMGPTYEAGSICDMIYPISASSVDYAKGVCKVKYAFGVELIGTTFEEPKTKIIESFNRLWKGILAMEKAILKKPPF